MTTLTAIFDIGKTNKKVLLFDTDCNIVFESSAKIPETIDEEGFPCEDILLLKKWIDEKWTEVISNKKWNITHLNFTTYGASFVHLDENNNPLTPLYSYLKSYPVSLTEKLYEHYNGKWKFSAVTSSPPLGMLNSGLQLFWLKQENPEVFKNIKTSLHLPQYIAFLFSKSKTSDYTSIGCHTALWDFSKNNYHQWVTEEGIDKVLAPINSGDVSENQVLNGATIKVGTGLHDSSSALIPYLKTMKAPFLLISTGTWCITLNPFNHNALTTNELSKDCLCYLTPQGKPVKASRIFLGKEHEFQMERITKHFGKEKNYFQSVKFNTEEIRKLLGHEQIEKKLIPACMEGSGPYPEKQI